MVRFFEFDPEDRVVPQIPAKDHVIPVIIDSDAKNEIDDQYAIALAILSPERFEIRGFVGAQYDQTLYRSQRGKDPVEASAAEIEHVLKLAGVEGRYPVYRGSHPMQYHTVAMSSAGVDFIVETARKHSPKNPLWVIGLGAATDIASAILTAPEIMKNIVVYFHGRTRWPESAYNFNVYGDFKAAQLLFHAPVPLVLFDTGTDLVASMEETEKNLCGYGALGTYLHEYRKTNPYFMQKDKGMFDLGDITALADPGIAGWEVEQCPEVDYDFRYLFKNSLGRILRCYHVDKDRSFGLLYSKIQKAFPRV